MNYSFQHLHELIRMIKYEVRKQFFLGREQKQSIARTRLALLNYLYLSTSRKLTDNSIGSLSLILKDLGQVAHCIINCVILQHFPTYFEKFSWLAVVEFTHSA